MIEEHSSRRSVGFTTHSGFEYITDFFATIIKTERIPFIITSMLERPLYTEGPVLIQSLKVCQKRTWNRLCLPFVNF